MTTTEDKTYNGWKNYETWCVKLWLDNDQGTYDLQQEWAEQEKGTSNPAFGVMILVKEFVEECNPLADQASLFTDLLGAALSEVDWHEIAEAILSDG